MEDLYLGGFKTYIDRLDEVADAGYRGFVFTERQARPAEVVNAVTA